MKTKEELGALKEEVKTLNRKLAELSGDELEQVCGGDLGKIIQDTEQDKRGKSWE